MRPNTQVTTPDPAVTPMAAGRSRGFTSLSTAMFKSFYRDWLSVGFSVFFPLFFIIIFGTIFSGGGSSAAPTVIQVGAVPVIDQLPPEAKAALDDAVTIEPGTTLEAALAEVQKGDAGGAIEQQGNTLIVHYSSADQVTSATVQGIFNAFVNEANIAASGVPPTYQLDTQQVEDQSLKPIQFIALG